MNFSGNTKKPVILMLLYSMPPMPMGGAEMQAIKLIKALKELGINSKVITWGKLWHSKKGIYDGVEFVRVRSILNLVTDIPSFFRRRKKMLSARTKILYDDKKEVTNRVVGKVGLAMILRYQIFYISCIIYLWRRRHQFDIIHVHMMEWPAFVGVWLGKKYKKQVVLKDSTMNGIFNILRYPKGTSKQQQISQNAHCVAMTRVISENFQKAGVPASHISLIPNGIIIQPIPVEKSSWNQKVIFTGNLTQQPAKGVDILLLAWKEVTVRFPEATLQIIGSGDIEAYRRFTEQINIGSSVNFLGRQTEVRQLLLNADIFVLPSRREGMSNALMEAMTCAMPVVATEISGNQDLIEHGVSGLLVQPSNVGALAGAIIQLLNDPLQARALGKNAYQSVREKCDMEIVAKRYEDMYYQLLQTPR